MTQRNMDILFVIDSIKTAQAGTENQLLKLIDGLSARGHSTRLCTLWETEWMNDNQDSVKCESWTADVQHFRRLSTYRNIMRLAISGGVFRDICLLGLRGLLR